MSICDSHPFTLTEGKAQIKDFIQLLLIPDCMDVFLILFCPYQDLFGHAHIYFPLGPWIIAQTTGKGHLILESLNYFHLTAGISIH